MKVTLSKATNEGEALSVAMDLKDASEWDKKVAPALAALDARMLEMNMRMVMAHRALEHFPTRYHAAIKVMLDALHGCRTDALSGIPSLLADAERSEHARAVTEAARSAGETRDPVPDVVMADEAAMEEPA